MILYRITSTLQSQMSNMLVKLLLHGLPNIVKRINIGVTFCFNCSLSYYCTTKVLSTQLLFPVAYEIEGIFHCHGRNGRTKWTEKVLYNQNAA